MIRIFRQMIRDIQAEERKRLRQDRRKVLHTMARWACDPAVRQSAQAEYKREFGFDDAIRQAILSFSCFGVSLDLLAKSAQNTALVFDHLNQLDYVSTVRPNSDAR
jgi:hypothetical protein